MQSLPASKLFNFDFKSAYLIIHAMENKALEIPILNVELKQYQPEFTVINQKNSKCLWIVDQREPGMVQLVNGFTDKVLTAEDQKGTLTIRRGKGVEYQYWVLEPLGNSGRVRISNAKFRTMYLSFNTFTKKPILKQNAPDEWQFRVVTRNQQLNKTCFIMDPLGQKMIDVPQSSRRQQQTIYVWKPNYRFNQRWRLHKAGEVYIIKSYINDLNLDINQQNYEQNQKIIQYHSTGGMNQLWMLEKIQNSNDGYRIYSFAEPEYQLGHNEKKLKIYKGRKFVWKIQGYVPE